MIDLKTFRLACQFEQEQMAEYLGTTVVSIANWENGRRAMPATAVRLLQVLSMLMTLAPDIHATLLPGPPRMRKKAGRRPGTPTLSRSLPNPPPGV